MTRETNKETKPVSSRNDFFDPMAVRAKKTAQDWSEAVHIAGQYLVDSGKIETRYVEAMEKVILEIGPYAVIAPGIVLLHARPEDGVIKPCFGLITLSSPVPFGHSQNDPVDLVFTMGAIDKNGHIQALQRLANLLGDPANLEKLRAAEDDKTLLAVIQSQSGSG
jgi:mannitol/fructose-specific phosphotransferase system IIA component (Ntr-type)